MLAFKLFFLLIGLVRFFIPFLSAFGQSIEITAPLQTVTVKEGDDFAKDQLNNPWDFNERRDFGWEQFYPNSTIKVAYGRWKGVNSQPGAYVFPLFGGFLNSVYAEGLPGDRTLPRYGINHPINTSKYYVLSYKLKQTNPSSYCVYWNNNKTVSLWPNGDNSGASFDGFYHNNKAYRYPGWFIYTHDLSNLRSFQIHKGSWTNKVYALRLDPSFAAPAGSITEFDWIRLVDPNSAPALTISWNAYNIPRKALAVVYVDSNNKDYNGTALAYIPAVEGAGSYTFSTATLPPGNYYFYVKLQEESALATVATSGYSSLLRVNVKPTAYFTAPTPISGEDYAASVVGNPWDMNGPEDLSNIYNNSPYPMRQFYGETFSNGQFNAIADPYANNTAMTDAQLHLRMSSTPIDTRKFRYITYRMKIDNSQFKDLSDMVEFGFVTRVVMWNQGIFVDGVTPPPHVTYEGWHTYTYDMRGTNAGSGFLTEGGRSYKEFTSIANFRVDPMETSIPAAFGFDWVKFSAENAVSNNRYVISWVTQDSDSSNFTVKIYRDRNNRGYDGTLIAQLTDVPAGAYSYSWNTKGLSSGAYYIYLVISDGTNTFSAYSPVHIAVGSTTSISQRRTKYDYDGDGKSDQVVFRPGSTGKFIIKGSLRRSMSLPLGKTGDKPYEGDIDGDRKADPIITRFDGSGNILWYGKKSSDGTILYRLWGKRGDSVAIGDYDGDGKDDFAVFRKGSWYIYYATGQQAGFVFGATGDKPVAQDYDGDGRTDLAVWRPSNYTWYIKNSGYSGGYAPTATTTLVWGVSGQTPIAADFTGDGRADLGLFNSSTAQWFVRDVLNKNNFFSTSWGNVGDIMIAGDFNGDLISDFAAIGARSYDWKLNYRNGLQSTVQWGLGNDLIPR
ncbi:MAG: VCBS repeat-containing protein [Deltaproteobacteria bacterium]|nr:VCBS repeat-containing protein [Deltaproteobacteria bacterium]